MVFDAEMPERMGWLVTRIRMWEMGHSFGEIDTMGVEDVGHIIGYWTGKNRGEERLRRMHQRHAGKGQNANAE